jgi:micrococcal nuclease
VTNVIDGDTIVVSGGQRIRLLNIDARERGEDCYNEAKKRLEELIEMKNITMEKDVDNKDKYDRLLRYIFINGTNVNIQLVREGLAIVYIYEPNVKYQQEFKAAEQQAMQEKTGCLWVG